MNAKTFQNELNYLATPERAKASQWFFKNGKGEYGEGDVFRGVSVPACRKLVSKYLKMDLAETQNLLDSKWHEDRLCGLILLSEQFPKSRREYQQKIYDFYLLNLSKGNINNWDLVDCSAHKVVGRYLEDKPRDILFKMANSNDLWTKRVSAIATFWFFKSNDFEDSMTIAKILLNDEHDLIHKAVGWMLREVGKRDQKLLEDFLAKNYKSMPRTMLRYSIERFEESKRKAYLTGNI